MSKLWKHRQELWDKASEAISAFLKSRGIERPPIGFDIHQGWHKPVFEALDKMIAAGWDKRLSQVKQKFGGLCIYVEHPVSDEVWQIIKQTEAIVNTMCEYCGGPHGRKVPLSGTALCKECDKAELELLHA